MGATVTKIGAIGPDELADLCRQVKGCRVEMNGTTYVVYPPDPDKRPVWFSSLRLRTPVALENKISDLRRNGVDIRAVVNGAAPKPGPPKPAPPNPAQEAPTVTSARVPDISPTMTRKEGADLREQVRKAVEHMEAVTGLLAQAEARVVKVEHRSEDLAAELDEVRAELRHLHSGPEVKPKPVPMTTLVRDGVLAFFVAHPGMRLTPALIEANIGDDLPPTRNPTSVGHACKELVKAGKLQGGATRDTPAARKGIYWYEIPADPDAGA